MNKDFVLDFVAGGMDCRVKVQCTLVQVHPVYIPPSIWAIIFCEMFSREGVSAAVSKTVVAPLERVKLLLQIQV